LVFALDRLRGSGEPTLIQGRRAGGPVKERLVLVTVFVFLIGCGGGSSGGSQSQQATPVNIAGDWQITAKSTVFGFSATVTGFVNQSGGTISGQLAISGSPCAVSATMAGTVSGTAVTIQIDENGQPVTLSGTASVDGNSASGTYTATTGGCLNGDTGTWTATRVPPGGCVPAPTGLLSWWRGEGNAADATGTNPGTIEGGTTFAPGEVGQAFSFDGSTGYVNVPDSLSLDSIKTAESVELWVNPTTPNGTEYIYARRQPLIAESFSIFVQADGTLGILVATTTSPTPSGSKFQSASGTIVFGQFQHIVVAASTVTGNVTAYLNGVAVPLTNALGPTTLTGNFAAVNQLYLARREDLSVGEGVSGAGYAKGLLDEVSLYTTALDQGQAAYLFHAGSGGKCAP
jgi:hypothetical protein